MSHADMDPETLRILCDYSLELVAIRQSHCKHLCTENNGPETLANVLRAYYKDQMVVFEEQPILSDL